MNWNFKVNITTLLVIALGVVVFFYWSGKKNGEITRWKNNAEYHASELTAYQDYTGHIMKTQANSIVYLQQELRQSAEKDSIQAEMIKKYKRLSAVIKVETKFVHDTLEVEVPIYIDRDTSMQLWYDCFDLDLSVSSGLLSVDRISIDNTQDIVLGAKKTGLFKTSQVIDIYNSNPCLNTTGINSKVVVREKKWWENPIITTLGGFTAGFIVGKLQE